MKKIDYQGSYSGRREKHRFLLRNFADYFKGSILDVGCDQAYLKSFLNQIKSNRIKYIGIDKMGTPDIIVDLEKSPLPFRDKEFDFVYCLDVLEHLNNAHEIFDELVRVSRKFILLSLPNNFYLWERIRVMRGVRPNDKYGLLPNPPEDWHKWFFNINDAIKFISYRSKINRCRIKKKFPFYKTDGKLGLVRTLFKKFGLFSNLFAMSYWALLEREDGTKSFKIDELKAFKS